MQIENIGTLNKYIKSSMTVDSVFTLNLMKAEISKKLQIKQKKKKKKW